MAQYFDGQMTFTTGQQRVVGVGTDFIAAGIVAGMPLSRKGSGVPYFVGAVIDGTNIDLTGSYLGISETADYLISLDTTSGGVPKPGPNDRDATLITSIALDMFQALLDGKASSAIATLAAAGLVELATQAEVDAGSDAERALTPATLANYSGKREKLTSARNYYVDGTSGSDSSDGKSTGTGAFATIQKAIDAVAGLDLAGFGVTINVANGTYAAGAALKSYLGNGPVAIVGDTATPASCVLQTGFSAAGVVGKYEIRGFRIDTAAFYCVHAAGAPTNILLGNMEYGSAAVAHIRVEDQAVVNYNSDYKITAESGRHILVLKGGIITSSGGAYTITLTGTQNYAWSFIDLQLGALAQLNGQTYDVAGATVTGKRHSVSLNAVIDTIGGGVMYFPGSIAGTDVTGGVFA